MKYALTSPNAEDESNFGDSVALHEGYVFVSAPYETVDVDVYRRVYVYTLTAKAVTLAATINAPLTSKGFACSLAFDGSYLVVGSEYSDYDSTSSAGSAYVYSISGSTATLTTTLYSQHPVTYGRFGQSVGISGGKMVVGASVKNVETKSSAGRVYVFIASSGTLQGTLTSPRLQSSLNGQVGCSVAIEGSTIVIEAPYEDRGLLGYDDNAGYAYIYSTSDLTATPTTLTSPLAYSQGKFGYSVATNAAKVVVGAVGERNVYNFAGKAHVFTTSGAWTKTLLSANPVYNGYFDLSVAIGGRLTVVGAPDETANTYVGAGNAYIFR